MAGNRFFINNEWNYGKSWQLQLTNNFETNSTSGKTSPPKQREDQQGPKINYTKDELAKYNDLFFIVNFCIYLSSLFI